MYVFTALVCLLFGLLLNATCNKYYFILPPLPPEGKNDFVEGFYQAGCASGVLGLRAHTHRRMRWAPPKRRIEMPRFEVPETTLNPPKPEPLKGYLEDHGT